MKKSKLLLIAGILGTAYVIYGVLHFMGAVGSSAGTEQAGAVIASLLVAPHLICAGIAVVFNWIGYLTKARWAALTAGILYAVSMVLFPLYFMFVVIQTILCFVAFSRMKKATSE